MTVPAWVITGLLDSGKTTLINRLIEEKLDELDILVLQFESGETPLTEHERVKKLVFSKKPAGAGAIGYCRCRDRISEQPQYRINFN